VARSFRGKGNLIMETTDTIQAHVEAFRAATQKVKLEFFRQQGVNVVTLFEKAVASEVARLDSKLAAVANTYPELAGAVDEAAHEIRAHAAKEIARARKLGAVRF
jgi:hypothetical protein